MSPTSVMPAGRRRRMLTLGVVIIVAVLAAQLGLAAWTGTVADKGVTAALQENFTYVADVSAATVGDFVESSEATTEAVVRWMEADAPTRDEVARRILTLRAANPELRAIVVAYADDSFVAVVPGKQDEPYAYVVAVATADARGGGEFTLYGYGKDLILMETEHKEWETGGKELGFWDAAAPAYELVWTDPALRPLSGDKGAWAARRVLDADGAVAAVVGTDFSLDALAASLNSLPLGDDGEVYLLDSTRRVLAAPADDQPTVAAGFSEDGGLPAEDLQIATTSQATPFDIAVRFGTDGRLRTAERGLQDIGVPWVLHLSASDHSLAPGVLHLATVLRWATWIMLGVLLVAAAIFVAVRKPLRDMHSAAYTDGLTGLSTRRRFVEFAGDAIATAHREGGHVCVVVLDIDNFKRINDTDGHDAGDAALATMGQTLLRHVRQGDLVARWGGDEFVALLVMKDGKVGIAAMERLRAAAERALVDAFPAHGDLGVTAGGASSASGSDRVEDLVRVADEALVAGKQRVKSRSYAALG
ncbi:sensor domain-containing diguanylate cyclase [Demequina capsici]|uniref:Diguanylate cyclase n=1 Tax=Demequina capsici TaxID=3075620 RepID=A0AA96J9A3_9MICO|nr:diguanylate cyclase [Demequina sp. OYTSA14]WNM23311.1 diguanylate cyclase [Demequina sp. OYTSA14]